MEARGGLLKKPAWVIQKVKGNRKKDETGNNKSPDNSVQHGFYKQLTE